MVLLPERSLIYDLIEKDQLPDGVNLKRIMPRLMEHHFFESWPLMEELNPYLNKLGQVDESVLILTEPQKAQRRQAIIEEAATEIFSMEKKADLKRCLEDTALLLWQTGEKDLAGGTLAAALDLDKETGVISQCIFIEQLVQFSFDLFMESGDEPKGPFQKTDSGLIIPTGP